MDDTFDRSKDESGVMNGQVRYTVYYEDTDLSGFVYHANYLRYFERAREHIIGVDFLAQLYREGLHFVVSQASLRFIAPLGHADEVMIESDGFFSRSPAIPFKQRAYRKNGADKPTLVCEADITIVALNRDHKPVRMPTELLTHFRTRTNQGGFS